MELVLPDRISAKSPAAPLLDCQVGAERHGCCALVLASCPGDLGELVLGSQRRPACPRIGADTGPVVVFPKTAPEAVCVALRRKFGHSPE